MTFIFSKTNPYQHAKFANSSNEIVGEIYEANDNVKQYFYLKNEIQLLRIQNEILQNKVKGHKTVIGSHFSYLEDTVYMQQYEFQQASVIQATKSNVYNYITLNKGSANGISTEMGVIGTKGILGYVVACSKHYATVLPIIHPKFELAVRHKNSKTFGLLTWGERDNWQTASLNDISDFTPIKIGDTIETTGGDGFFPEGELVGTVKKSEEVPGKGVQLITVELFENYGNIHSVYTIKNLTQIELKQQLDSIQINE